MEGQGGAGGGVGGGVGGGGRGLRAAGIGRRRVAVTDNVGDVEVVADGEVAAR